MHSNLIMSTKTTRVNAGAVAGSSDITSGAWLDMEGFDSVKFTALFGTLSSGAVTSIKVQASNDSGGSSAVDLAGATLSIAEDRDDDVLILEVTKLQGYRYVHLHIDRATGNAVLDGVIAEQYSARKSPTTHDSTTVAGALLSVSPQPVTTGLTETTVTYTGTTTTVSNTARTSS